MMFIAKNQKTGEAILRVRGSILLLNKEEFDFLESQIKSGNLPGFEREGIKTNGLSFFDYQNPITNETVSQFQYNSIHHLLESRQMFQTYKKFIFWFYNRFGNRWINPFDFEDEIWNKIREFGIRQNVSDCFKHMKRYGHIDEIPGDRKKSVYRLSIK